MNDRTIFYKTILEFSFFFQKFKQNIVLILLIYILSILDFTKIQIKALLIGTIFLEFEYFKKKQQQQTNQFKLKYFFV